MATSPEKRAEKIEDAAVAELVRYEVYRTPPWVVEDTYAFIAPLLWLHRRTLAPRILDIGADQGQWGQEARRVWPDAEISGIEVRDVPPPATYDRWFVGDYADADVGDGYDLIISNPPFTKAVPFVLRALTQLAPHGLLVMFLRSAFIHGADRYEQLHSRHRLYYLAVFPNRPIFANGKSDTKTEYALAVWMEGYTGPRQLEILPPRPVAERLRRSQVAV